MPKIAAPIFCREVGTAFVRGNLSRERNYRVKITRCCSCPSSAHALPSRFDVGEALPSQATSDRILAQNTERYLNEYQKATVRVTRYPSKGIVYCGVCSFLRSEIRFGKRRRSISKFRKSNWLQYPQSETWLRRKWRETRFPNLISQPCSPLKPLCNRFNSFRDRLQTRHRAPKIASTDRSIKARTKKRSKQRLLRCLTRNRIHHIKRPSPSVQLLTVAVMGPRKGLSFEEKRTRLSEIFTETVRTCSHSKHSGRSKHAIISFYLQKLTGSS